MFKGKPGNTRTVRVHLPQTKTGKVQHRCPNESCEPLDFFLGRAADDRTLAPTHKTMIRRLPGEPGTTCPYCGTDGDDDAFRKYPTLGLLFPSSTSVSSGKRSPR